MLNALELFHYSYRFQNRTFILTLDAEIELQSVITDLRVLHAAHIQNVVICKDDDKLKNILQVWNSRGCPFDYISIDIDDRSDETLSTRIEASLKGGNIPIVGCLSKKKRGQSEPVTLDAVALGLAARIIVDKVFFLTSSPGLYINDRFISHSTQDELNSLILDHPHVNIGVDRLRQFVDANATYGFDIVIIEGRSGDLFQEIFTHRGVGTLIASKYPNVIRNGVLSDVMDISLLMKPYIQSGRILPVDEDELATVVTEFLVYTVNNSIVAAARLKDHGKAAELSKFCTLPRYQGKGRAKELAEKMISLAKEQNKQYVFALSIEPKMVDFFKNLGFKECDRSALPETWREDYDLGRPSLAFRKDT